MPTLYATLAEFKASDDTLGTKYDAKIQECLDAAAEVIDGFCNRTDGFVAGTASARVFMGNGCAWLYAGECVQVTTVETKLAGSWSALSASDYIGFSGDAQQPDFNSLPYAGVLLTGAIGSFSAPAKPYPNWRITAQWGYSATVPPQIKSACIAQASRWFKRGQSRWADTLANSDMGQLMVTKIIDPDIAMMLREGRLIRPTIG